MAASAVAAIVLGSISVPVAASELTSSPPKIDIDETPLPPAENPFSEVSSEQPPLVRLHDPSLDGEDKTEIAGTLVAYAVEDGEGVVQHRVLTQEGESIAVSGITESVQTGSRISAEVVEPVDETAAVATATVERVTQAVSASKSHTFDVAVVLPRGDTSGNFFSEAKVKTLVKNMVAYWVPQSRGQLTNITLGQVAHYTSANTLSYGGCNPHLLWSEAKRTFGKSENYYETNSKREHLIVLSPDTCDGGTGLGLIGDGFTSGGTIWAALDGLTDLHTVSHEFGHNLGLRHSNVHVCPDSGDVEGIWSAKEQAFNRDCSDLMYADYFDMMGGGFVVDAGDGTYAATDTLTALNPPHRASLGLYGTGELRAMSLPAGTRSSETQVALTAASATKGVRALKITDPRTGELYFVEYRSGTGVDKGALYATSAIGWEPEIGVRVLKSRPDGTTAVLLPLDDAGRGYRNLHLEVGEHLTVYGGGTTISVAKLAPETATVRVSLASRSADVVVKRIAGADRYETAVNISKAGFPGEAPVNVPVVFISTGQDYPDALSAAPAAVAQGGPLLLTMRTKVPPAVAAELKRLKPKKIVVVGGTAAISNSVVTQLKKYAGSVKRVAGKDRFETSRLVTSAFFKTADAAYVATGLDYPDALSASAAGGSLGFPVVLVDGRKGKKLDATTAGLLKSLKVTKVYVAGGTAVVNNDIHKKLATLSDVKRFAGADRFETSRLINRGAFPKATQSYLATGMQFPDALAGAALAGKNAAPLYVVKPKCVPGGVVSDLGVKRMEKVTLLGGTSALTKAVQSLTRC